MWCHRNILAARSEHFENVLCRQQIASVSKGSNQQNIINIEDYEPNFIRSILLYLYTNKIEFANLFEKMEFLRAADKWQIT